MVHEPAWTYALNTEINTFNEGKNLNEAELLLLCFPTPRASLQAHVGQFPNRSLTVSSLSLLKLQQKAL